MNKAVGLVVGSWLALGLPFLVSGQSPHDRGGVGAMGLIGRGTIAEERPSAVDSAPLAVSPAYMVAPTIAPVALPPIAPSRPQPVTMSTVRATDFAAASPAERSPTAAASAVARQPARARINPYVRYDRSWLRGYWSLPVGTTDASVTSMGERSRTGLAGPARGAGARAVGPGRGLGWGLASWLIGPMIYRWGYMVYGNPFLDEGPTPGAGPVAIHDYAHPVDLSAPPPAEAVLLEGLRDFGEARAAFRREAYIEALGRVDAALALTPDSPSLHLFRGLTLVALHRYREAAAVFHATIAVVPGWDWSTMMRLYHNADTYTRQLRTLESYSQQNPRSAAGHFLLGVQYLTTGYPDAAVGQLRQVEALLPDDELTLRLIRELRPPAANDVTAPTGRRAAADLEGNWIARPHEGTTITLTFQPRGHITWSIDERGQVRRLEGFGLLADRVLTVTEDPDNAMAGRVDWEDARHFTFTVLESRPGDSGLSFAKTP